MNLLKTLFIAVIILNTSVLFSQNHSKMNLANLHNDTTGVHTHMMFQPTSGKVISLQILKGHELKEHVTNVPALLVCVNGNVVFEDENGKSITLTSGDYVNIEVNVKHWVKGIEDSQLLLIK